jgi:hypothetical protein
MMLSSHQVRTVASILVERLGPVTPAAAILRAQEAHRRGAFAEMQDWRRIAEQALHRLSDSDPGFAAEADGGSMPRY